MSHLDLSDIEALGSGLLDLTDEMQYSGDLVNSDSRVAFLHKSELREIKIVSNSILRPVGILQIKTQHLVE